MRERRDDVRRDRAGQRPLRASSSGSTAARGRSRSTTSRASRRPRRRWRLVSAVRVARGEAALVTGGSRGIGRAIALELGRAGADGRRRLPHRPRRGRGSRGRDRRPRGRGGRLRCRVGAGARRGGRRRRHPRQQRRPHARRAARADERRGLAHGDRHEPLVGLLHLPRRGAADDAKRARVRSSTSPRSSACTGTGARRTTPRRRRGSSASRSRSPASSEAVTCGRTSSRPGTSRPS